MNKQQQILDILMLLSALESWSFSTKNPLPDYLHDTLMRVVEQLAADMVKGEHNEQA